MEQTVVGIRIYDGMSRGAGYRTDENRELGRGLTITGSWLWDGDGGLQIGRAVTEDWIVDMRLREMGEWDACGTGSWIMDISLTMTGAGSEDKRLFFG